MNSYTPAEVEGTDLEPRDVRALTEYLTVLEDVGRAKGADGLYLVVSQSGSEYLVDARTGACECPDAEHRNPEGGCKHVRRVAYATGERPIPAIDGVDEQLGLHVTREPRTVATDGGVIEANDDEDDRPADCACTGSRLEAEGGLPCWPCYRDGFDEPNPNAPVDEDGEEPEDDTPRRHEPADFGGGEHTGVQDL